MMMQLGVLTLPLDWMPVQRRGTPAFCLASLTIHWYLSFIHLGQEDTMRNKVHELPSEHNKQE